MKRRDASTVLIILFLFMHSVAYTQYLKHKFERITVKDGLSNSTITCSLQDKTGFLWFANYAGVSKYDGYNITNYTHDPENPKGLGQSAVQFLFEDKEGKIWIVDNGSVGIDRYDPVYDSFEHIIHSPDDTSSLSSNKVFHIMQDSKDDIWISTDNALNQVVKENEKISFNRFYYPDNIPFTRTFENKDSVLLLFSDKIYSFDRELQKFIPTGTTISFTPIINSLVEDKEGNIYIGNISGIIKLKYNSETKTYSEVIDNHLNFTPNSRSCVIIDVNNQIWIGTETQGLFKYNPKDKEVTHFVNNEQDDNSLSDNSVQSLFIDQTGLLWIGTRNQGLSSYDLYQNKFYHYRSLADDPNSLIGNLITSIQSISSNEIWVSNRSDGGVNRLIFDDKENLQVIRYRHDPENENSIATNNVFCHVQRRSGEVWLGGGGTFISRIIPEDPKSDEEAIITRYPVGGWTFTIFEDSEGILWGGTWGGGLWRFDDTTLEFTYYTNNPDDSTSICDNVVWAIHEDTEKNIWIGGNKNGISVLTYDQKNNEKPEFINITSDLHNPKSISSSNINLFYQDTKGTMWIGTNGGLNYVVNSIHSIQEINKTKSLDFKVYTFKNDGLPSDGIMGIIEDQDSNLWISTSKGISFFNLTDSTFTNYYESDGLQSDEFWRNAYFINSSGKIFFGGKNGISAFYSKDIKSNPFIPEIALTDLKIFNKSVKIGEEINKKVVLEKSFNDLSELVLSYKDNVVTIVFAALHYTQPYKNQYAYYLEGFEDDWNYVENRREVTYTNLDPGKYTFRVKGSNSNGIWNEEGKSIIIQVKAPWWKTWGFRLLAISLFILFGFISIRRRIEMVKREKKKLHDKIEKGERELQMKIDEIEKQKREIEEQNIKESEIRYQHIGISKFSEIIAASRKNIDELSLRWITELVNYTETFAGIVYLIDDTDTSNIMLVNSGSYCFDSDLDSINNKPIIPGEGYVGTCYTEKKIIRIDNLPDGYIVLRSGLGNSTLRNCLFIPIVNEDNCLGIIELASINALEPYKVEFITKIAESFASVIAVNNANVKTSEILEQNKVQAEELRVQEEELRQNLEEMQATQEELKRQIEATKK